MLSILKDLGAAVAVVLAIVGLLACSSTPTAPGPDGGAELGVEDAGPQVGSDAVSGDGSVEAGRGDAGTATDNGAGTDG